VQYFEGLGFFWLLNGAGPQRGKTAGVGREEGEENVDNPDQRIQRDVALFADHLAQTAAQLVAVPFMVFYYRCATVSALPALADALSDGQAAGRAPPGD